MEKMEQPVDGLKEWRDAAQAQVSEPVIDACLFSRPTSYAGNVMSSHSGPIVGMLLRKSREIRAGGLPQHFVLAVTDREVVVLERVMTARGGAMGQPGGEVARWKRIYTLAWTGLYDDPVRPDHLQVERGLLTRSGTKKPAYFAYKNN